MLPLGILNSLTPWPVDAAEGRLETTLQGLSVLGWGGERRNKGKDTSTAAGVCLLKVAS